MAKVKNQHGTEIDFEAAVSIMDDDIREELHSQGIETEQEFFDRYCERHLEKYSEEFEPNKENPQW